MALVARHPRVVTGGDGVGPKAACPLEQGRKLQIAVAVSARKRSAPGCVFTYEICNDPLVELTLEIQDVMGDV